MRLLVCELLTRPDGPALSAKGLWEGKSQGPLPPSFSPLKGGLLPWEGPGPCPQGQVRASSITSGPQCRAKREPLFED